MSLDTGNTNIISNSSLQVTEPGYVTSTDPFAADNQNVSRANQQSMLPGSTKSRFVSVVQQYETIRKLFNANVPDGASLIINTITENSSGNMVVQFVARQVYIGSPSSSTRMPEVISSSLYPHYDWDSALDSSGVSILKQPGTAVHKTQVRNNSGAAQQIYVEIVTRYIVNNSSQASQ